MTVLCSCPLPGVVSSLFPSKPPAPGRWQECLTLLPPPPPISPLPSPRRGQPAGPKIATANKEMSSLGLLSLSAGAHFFQLWFKLRNTNVFLVSACCQHFCRACSGATGRAHKLSGEDFEKQFCIFFFPSAWNQGNFSVCISPRLQGREVKAWSMSPRCPSSTPTPRQPDSLPWGAPLRCGSSLTSCPFCPSRQGAGSG